MSERLPWKKRRPLGYIRLGTVSGSVELEARFTGVPASSDTLKFVGRKDHEKPYTMMALPGKQ